MSGLTSRPELVDDRLAHRLHTRNWDDITSALDVAGYAVMPGVLNPAECWQMAALYHDETIFRTRIVMGKHGFGEGEYQYFTYPLPSLVQALRTAAYPPLARLANVWRERLDQEPLLPPTLAEFLTLCHEAGQTRPTPLLLKYGPGDYNRLHQDRYGDLVFPLQLTVLLSDPGEDFEGGDFVLTEQRPRMQSRAEVVPLQRGDAVIFTVHQRPMQGTRGYYRVQMRDGVSTVRRGARHTLGIIFHDAR